MFRILCLFANYVILCGVCKCDLTLFVKRTYPTKYKFTCVATGAALKSALTWLPKNLERNVQMASTYTFNTSIPVTNMTIIGDSSMFGMPPVLDYRWESFPTIIIKGIKPIITSNVWNISSINISILFRNNFSIILKIHEESLCANVMEYDRQTLFPFEICRLPTFNSSYTEIGYPKWMHFTIYKKQDKYYLNRFGEEETYEKFSLSTLEVASPIAQVKLHNYTIFSGKPDGTQICISFHVFTIGPCTGLAGSQKKEWIEIKTTDENINIDDIQYCPMSGMRYCSISETRIMQLESNDTKVECGALINDTISLNYRLPRYTTKSTTVLGTSIHDASNYVTCNLEDGCYCSQNNTGDFCETGPNKVTNLTASMFSPNSVIVRWKPPKLHHEEVELYKVEYFRFGINDSIENTFDCSLWDSYKCIELKSLLQNVRYNISVSTKIKGVGGFGLRENFSIITTETSPEGPGSINIEIINCTLILRWNHPERINGKLIGFFINIVGTWSNYSTFFEVKQCQSIYTYEKSNLTIGQYQISIQAKNDVGLSDPSSVFEVYIKECSLQQNDMFNWIKQNTFYFYIICAAAGLFFIFVCCSIIFRWKKSSAKKKVCKYSNEDLPLMEEHRVILRRTDISNVLKLWVENNVGDTHIRNEFTDADKKIRYLYKQIIQRDACRVKVKDVTCDSDANAHFIQGCKGNKSYIAAQCPKSNNMNEAFWTVVWDEKVSIIVSLLTNEEAMNNQYDYWSNNNSNSIKVKLNYTRDHCDFVLRNITITRLEDTKNIIQLNYFTWPHNGIPLNPLSFVNFLMYVKSRDVHSGPILVHCSEGFGRTGTYIMCDYFLNSVDVNLNVSKYLEVVSKCRPYLIKTYLQYKFVYFVIDELNTRRETCVKASTFLSNYTEMMESNLPGNIAYIKTRRYIYKLLYCDEEYRDSDWTEVPGYQNQDIFYVRKPPDLQKIHDMWNFVYSNRIRHVLLLQDLYDINEKFWPSKHRPLEFESLNVRITSCSSDKYVKLYRVEVQRMNEESIEVVLLRFKHWDRNGKVPSGVAEFYEFYKMFNDIKSTRDNKIVVCCNNGATASGLFICFDLILKKLKSEEVFDLVWAVLSIKHKQEHFMDKLEQHQFMYKLFEYFLSNVETYTTYNEYSCIGQSCHPVGYDLIATGTS